MESGTITRIPSNRGVLMTSTYLAGFETITGLRPKFGRVSSQVTNAFSTYCCKRVAASETKVTDKYRW